MPENSGARLMDAILQSLKRKSTASDSAEDWRDYARALERSFGLAPAKTYAVPTDGELCNDLYQAWAFVDYKDGDTGPEIYKRYLAAFFAGEQCPQCVNYLIENEWCYDQCLLDDCADCTTFAVFQASHNDCKTDHAVLVDCIPWKAWIIDEPTAYVIKRFYDYGRDENNYLQDQLGFWLKLLAQDSALKTITFDWPAIRATIKSQSPTHRE